MQRKDNKKQKSASLALGSFDGLHIGHLSILNEAKRRADEQNLRPVAMIFDIHPKKVLSNNTLKLLMTQQKKIQMLEDMGFEVEIVPFLTICNLGVSEFFEFLLQKFDPKVICCGFNYNYAKNAQGNCESLKSDCKRFGIELFVGEAVSVDGEIVSSTLIRQLISTGEIEKANSMLGRPFSFSSVVIHGDARGRTIGVPTANQLIDDELVCPKYGVYASMVQLNGKKYPAATNIGIRPTIGGGIFLLETHIIGFDGDLYGKDVEVFLLSYIREETDCGSLEALKRQLHEDRKCAKRIFSEVKENGKA